MAAVIFVGVVVFAFGETLLQGVLFGAFMFALYVPLGYYTDRFFYRRRQRKKEAEREARRRERGRRAGG